MLISLDTIGVFLENETYSCMTGERVELETASSEARDQSLSRPIGPSRHKIDWSRCALSELMRIKPPQLMGLLQFILTNYERPV